jgi:stage II sporulation protein Q
MEKAKRLVVPTIYTISLLLIIGSIFLLVSGISSYFKEIPDYDYAIKNVFNDSNKVLPVQTTKSLIIKPYLSENVSIGKYFYDFEGEREGQEKALVYYENTYMQNSGVDYISNSVFDVVSILDGEVISVEKDNTLGNIVKVKHEKDLISIYQGIDEVSVSKGDSVTQGQILGVSSTSKINPEYNSSLHFEVYYKGEIIDPENLYTLSIEDLQ